MAWESLTSTSGWESTLKMEIAKILRHVPSFGECGDEVQVDSTCWLLVQIRDYSRLVLRSVIPRPVNWTMSHRS